MDVFYAPHISTSDYLVLDHLESGHCIRVLRHRKGDLVRLVDGKGGYFKGQIQDDNPENCGIKIQERLSGGIKMSGKLHVCIAPTKRMDRFEWFLEKATEIGVTSITPILCQRSERKKVRIDRMEKILVSAMKQSGRAELPQLHEPVNFKECVSGDTTGSKFIAYCGEGKKNDIRKVEFTGQNTILIGPEGDFTDEEVIHAVSHGYMALSMGAATLRTETAGVMICAAASLCMVR